MNRIVGIFSIIFLFFFQFLSEGVEVSADKLQALKYRSIGPTRGGRSTAVTGFPGSTHSFLMGNSGGLWRSDNAGQTWENISDGAFETGSIGAIAVSQYDPNVIYVGTGQACLRGNIAIGVGMYRSVDGGKTWHHSGLRKAGQIARVRIHPKNPDIVYVAVLGQPFSQNEERGVYRTIDGGKTWERVLYISPKTGAGDLIMDPNNPRVLYAAAYTAQRKPWTIISGSEESALYKTVDGGDHWVKLTGGLPEGVVGRIGVTVSPANSSRVWAIVEAEEGGIFRSEDAGETWTLLKTNMTRKLYQRGWYYMHIFADPKDQNRVYVLNVDQFRSNDGGITWEEIHPPHGDGHDLWIHPDDPRIMIMGNDGGATVSLDDAKTWSTQANQPTSEFYYVYTDDSFPYRVYGPQQDDTTISIPSRDIYGLTDTEHWRDVGGCEDGHIAFDPKDPTIVYAGCYGGEITRWNVKTYETRYIMHYPQMEIGLAPRDLRYRFNWNAPIRLSPHNPKVLYHASQFIHRSTDEGYSWEIISPDLSRNDKSKQDYAGEPITYENTGIEVYSNVISFEESPHKAGLMWAGSDDGLVHISQDNGKSWQNITPQGVPAYATVNSIELSPHDPGRTFITVLNYKLGDSKPYIFRTNDYGKTWSLLTDGKNGISIDNPTRVVREDPERKGLLYAGTEKGMVVSFDDGRSWQSLQLNLPIVPITDLKIHNDDLVISTQGRSFWILDDISVIRQLANGSVTGSEPHLFQPRPTYRIRQSRSDANPPNGVLLFYYFPENVTDEVTLEISDSNSALIASFSSDQDPDVNPEFPYGIMGRYEGDRKVEKKKGLNRFVWDLRYPPVDFVEGAIVWGYLGGTRVAPGKYKATIKSGDWTQTQEFDVLKDPRFPATQEDLQEQTNVMLRAQSLLNDIYRGVKVIRSIRQQTSDAADLLAETGRDETAFRNMAEELQKKLSAIEEELMQPRNEADQDTENYPTKLDNQLAYVYMQMNDADSRPGSGQVERINDLEKEIKTQLGLLNAIIETDCGVWNRMAKESGAVPILIPKQ